MRSFFRIFPVLALALFLWSQVLTTPVQAAAPNWQQPLLTMKEKILSLEFDWSIFDLFKESDTRFVSPIPEEYIADKPKTPEEPESTSSPKLVSLPGANPSPTPPIAAKSGETLGQSKIETQKTEPPNNTSTPAPNSAQSSDQPTPTPVPSPTPSPSPEPPQPPAPSPESSPTPEASPQPTPEPTPTHSPQGGTGLEDPLPAPSPSPDPTPEPGPSPEPSPTPTPEPSPSPSPEPTPSPSPAPSPTPEPGPSPEPRTSTWEIQGVSSMKITKDIICDPADEEFIGKWLDKAHDLGANYVSVETPYDSPSCGNSLAYTRIWVREIRERDMKVWHRHMPLAFEGIYGKSKDPNANYLKQISDYIKANPDLFAEGDIFTPIPEPQNGGIQGITFCHGGVCIFPNRENFNVFLRVAIDMSQDAFSEIGKNNIKIGYYGFDGFVAWGHNNPDWEGILEDETIAKMGNITIDHYPEAVGTTMEEDLNELSSIYPGIPIVIGEWGTIGGGDLEAIIKTTMAAAKNHPNVIGFNYWHLGMGGNESLIDYDFNELIHFDEVKSFFRP
ncbi:MAG: hypothetical protein NUV69_04745 [Candidatus Curtissbacteria bacterium]|nr:hypothetical protein [Candidatus Curtissbacteria bacterium]